MSWNGTHPKMSKEQAKANLPAGACKLCVYWERCQLFMKDGNFYFFSDCCNRCASVKSVTHAPFNKYQSDIFKILGALQQEKHYFWAVDTPVSDALKGLLRRKIVTFKDQQGILACYIALVPEFMGYKIK